MVVPVARYYFRRRGSKRVSLPGMPGSAEFNVAYATALAGNIISSFGAGRIKAGSLDALVLSLMNKHIA